MGVITNAMFFTGQTLYGDDCKFGLGQLTQQLEQAAKQSSNLGEQLANCDTKVTQCESAIQQANARIYGSQSSAAQDPRSSQDIGILNQYINNAYMSLNNAQNEKMYLKAQENASHATEKALTVKKNNLELQGKLADTAADSAKGLLDKDIERTKYA